MSKNRRLGALVCVVFGHDWVGHTTYKLESDTGRALYGDLCPRCGRFKPRENAKEDFNDPMKTVEDVNAFLENPQEFSGDGS